MYSLRTAPSSVLVTSAWCHAWHMAGTQYIGVDCMHVVERDVCTEEHVENQKKCTDKNLNDSTQHHSVITTVI